MADEEKKDGMNESTFEQMLDGLEGAASDDEPDTPEEKDEDVQEDEEAKEDAPDAAVEDATEDDDEIGDSDYTYVVQRGFTQKGRTFHPGDVIPVKCRYCALWEKEWLGKVRCAPGKPIDDTTMSADKFSCDAFFICQEMTAELEAFLAMDLPEVLTVRRMIPGIKKLLEAETWLSDHVDKKELEVDKKKAFATAKNFITSFTNVDQVAFIEQFIRSVATIQQRRQKERRPPKQKLDAGDWVEFRERKDGTIVKAIILSMGRGLIRLSEIDGPNAGTKWEFPLKEWKSKCEPKVVRKATSAD